MAINQLQLPSTAGLNNDLNLGQSLAQLGQVYQKGQAENEVRNALQGGFDSTNPQSLAALATRVLPYNNTLGLTLAQLSSSAANTQYQHGRDTNNDQWRQQEALRAQQNADRSYGLQERQATRLEDPTPTGFVKSPEGALKPIPGGPADPTYLASKNAAEGKNNIEAVVAQRKQAADSIGLAETDPSYKGFILTGKLPREDAQPLTATDKKAILEADELVQSTQGAIANLQKAKQLSKDAYSGPYADKRGYAASFLGETSDTGKAGIATTDLNNLVTTNALSQLKAIFGGNPTEGERAILLQIQGSANMPDAVRQKIYDRGIELANKRLEFNRQKADALRGNTYYKPGQQQPAPQPAAQATQPAQPQAGVVDWQTYFGGGN
jgi:hypothetical protein